MHLSLRCHFNNWSKLLIAVQNVKQQNSARRSEKSFGRNHSVPSKSTHEHPSAFCNLNVVVSKMFTLPASIFWTVQTLTPKVKSLKETSFVRELSWCVRLALRPVFRDCPEVRLSWCLNVVPICWKLLSKTQTRRVRSGPSFSSVFRPVRRDIPASTQCEHVPRGFYVQFWAAAHDYSLIN